MRNPKYTKYIWMSYWTLNDSSSLIDNQPPYWADQTFDKIKDG